MKVRIKKIPQNARKWHHEGGGMLNGMDNEQIYGKKNPLMMMNGPSHGEGGIDFLPDAEVEGGETIANNVVNSDTIEITKDIATQYKLPKKAIGKTVADYSKNIESQFEGRDGDPFAMNTRNRMISVVSRMSAELAPKDDEDNGEQRQFGGGGSWDDDYYRDANGTLRLTPEALEARTGGSGNYIGKSSSNNNYGLNLGREDYSGKINTSNYGLNNMSRINSFNIDNVPIRPNNTSNNSDGGSDSMWDPLSFNRDQPDPNLIMMDYDKRNNGIPTANTSNLQLGTKASNELMPSTLGDIGLPKSSWKDKLNMDNIGGTVNNILGLAPIAMSAFNAVRASRDKPEQVNIAPIHPERINPKLIDPEYQLKQVSDTFATGNEAMSQISKKDFLRRRIQSATEESKVKSGVLGAANAGNVQIRNRADEINQSNQLRADMFNTEAGLQEENINAANMGAYQSNRDFQRNNLATMMGEYARDTRLEKADTEYRDRWFDAASGAFGNNQSLDRNTSQWNVTGSPLGVDSGYVFPNSVNNNPTQQPMFTPEESQYPGLDSDFNSPGGIYNRYNRRMIPSLGRRGVGGGYGR